MSRYSCGEEVCLFISHSPNSSDYFRITLPLWANHDANFRVSKLVRVHGAILIHISRLRPPAGVQSSHRQNPDATQ